MSDANDQYDQDSIPDFVNDSIVAGSNPPQVVAPFELLCAGWARVICERLNARMQPASNLVREFAELALRGAREPDRVSHRSIT